MTNGPVGARLEVVQSKPKTDPLDRRYLLVLVFLSLVLHAWLIGNSSMTARDSIGFVRFAMNLRDPQLGADPNNPEHVVERAPGQLKIIRSILQVLKEEDHHPGYPAAIYPVYLVVKRLTDASIQDQLFLAAQIASALAALLTIFPTYAIGRMLFSRNQGFWCALIFQCLPVYARDTSDGLSEGLFLFFYSMGLWLSLRAVREPSVGRYLLTGLAVGAAYIVRPEGLFFMVPTHMGVAVVMIVRKQWSLGLALGWLTALLVGCSVFVAPYMYLINGVSNKPTTKVMVPGTKGFREQMISQRPIAGPILFAEWLPPNVQGSQRVIEAGRSTCKEFMKASHYSMGILAILGIVMLWPKIRQEPWFLLLLLHSLVVGGALLVVAYNMNYISERHALTLTLTSVYLAVGGLPIWFQKWQHAPWIGPLNRWPYWPAVCCLLIVLSCVPGWIRPLHDNRFGHKQAGLYLAEHVQQGDTIIDPYEWALFYSNQATYRVPQDPDDQKVRWAVLEVGKDGLPVHPHSLTPRHDFALKIAAGLDGPAEVVYQWPVGVPREQAEVIVVRQERKTP